MTPIIFLTYNLIVNTIYDNYKQIIFKLPAKFFKDNWFNSPAQSNNLNKFLKRILLDQPNTKLTIESCFIQYYYKVKNICVDVGTETSS